MKRKEYYKHLLPHYQQPGQTYFVTWILKDAIPPHVLKQYSGKLVSLKTKIDSFGGFPNEEPDLTNRQNTELKNELPKTFNPEIEKLLKEYHSLRKKYIKEYDELLAIEKSGTVDLMEPAILSVIKEALLFWEDKKLENLAFCIMSNHVHWVFHVKERDENGNSVYLQDIMHSVKRQTANQINKLCGRQGALWQKESFDTTIRDMEHEYNAVRYTLNNPVAARLVGQWKDWLGNWCNKDYAGCGF